LNAVTKQAVHALPTVSSLFEAVGKSKPKKFCLLDMKSAYWSLPIAKEDQPKTCFVVENFATYKFLKMPFGLTNAPSSFQSLMEKFLPLARGGQLDGRDGAACVGFIDDILIPGSTVAETSRRLKAVLDAIIKNGLKLAPKKCQLMQDELHFQGHHLSSEGISFQHEKICQIQNWPVPTSREELKFVLRLFAYDSGFVPNFAGLAAPLY